MSVLSISSAIHQTPILFIMPFITYPILSDIIHRVGMEGFRELGPFIAAGKFFKEIIFSDNVLSVVDIDEFIFVMGLSDEGSPYRPFLLHCLAARNHTAEYVMGLRLCIQSGPSQQGIDFVGQAAPHLLYARFAVAAFLCFGGQREDGVRVFDSFLEMVPNIEQAVYIGNQVCDQIQQISTPGTRSIGFPAWLEVPYCFGMGHNEAIGVCKHCFAMEFCYKILDLV